MSRCKGFNAILKGYASFELIEEIISVLISISSFREGYYRYNFTTISKNEFIKSHVAFAKKGTTYRFIVNSRQGFAIDKNNVANNLGKLIDIVPTMILYQYAKSNFEGTPMPINFFDFIKALNDYSGGCMVGESCNMALLVGDQDFNLRLNYGYDIENIYFSFDSKGSTYFLSRLEKNNGSTRIRDNYNMAMFQTMLSVNHFLLRSGFLTEDILYLAPNGA